ncbi:MAG TPA: S8 family peptidase [Thermoanaerobaculia bacterium]|nr:S8 family peptidase [Thermoanaerobaculia bacterium]
MKHKVAVGFAVVCLEILWMPQAGWARGGSPQDPIDISPGGQSITIDIARPGQAVWARATFPVTTGVSHGVFETAGSVDPRIYLYQDVDHAQQDRYFREDDDSGQGVNAKIEQVLSYPAPYYLKLTLFSASSTGRFTLRFSQDLRPPEACPSTGPCAMVVAVRGFGAAARTLRVMRNIRYDLLAGTSTGEDIIDLYYSISRDLVGDLLTNPELRGELLGRIVPLMPLLEEVSRVAVGQPTGHVVTAEEAGLALELGDLILEHVTPATGQRVLALMARMQVEAAVGLTAEAALAERGLLPAVPSPWALDEELRAFRRGEVLVKLRAPATPALTLRNGLLETGLAEVDRVLRPYVFEQAGPLFQAESARGSDLSRVLRLRAGPDEDVLALVAALRGQPEVEYAQLNGRATVLSEDVYFPHQYGLNNRTNPQADIDAPEAWSVERGRVSTLVAVIDTGIDRHHADLAGRVRTDLGFDFADGDPEANDAHGHGSHVSGILAAAADNRYAIAGVAPGVSVIPIKVLSDSGSGSWSDVAAGIVHAAQVGARVINLSLGGPDPDPVVEDSLRFAADRGVLSVAAAGNDGTEGLLYPASSPYTLSVGALDAANQLAYFSNFGAGLDLTAPGVDIVSLFQEGQVCNASGTSMATPHVAGVAALLASQDGAADRVTLAERLEDGARDLGQPGYDTRFGWGGVNAARSLALGAPAPGAACSPAANRMCLLGNRFSVMVDWRTANSQQGTGSVVPLSAVSGLFYFFSQDNIEMLFKIIDGCGLNDRFWVFFAATTNADLTVRVTDTRTGQVREYRNPLGQAALPVQDTGAFATCP